MARARNVKPGFFTNDLLAETGPLGMLLFEALWCLADREGRLEDRPKKLKIEALPYFDADVDALLNALAGRGFVVRYEAEGGRFIQIVNFLKHQNPHVKEAPSTIPAPPALSVPLRQAPDKHSTSPVQAPDEHGTSPADSGFPHPDSGLRIPDCGEPSRTGTRAGDAPPGGDSGQQAPPVVVAHPPEAIPPIPGPPPRPVKPSRSERATKAPAAFELTDEHYEYAESKGLTTQQTQDETERFLNWARAKGQTYVDWLAAWRNWIAKSVDYRSSPVMPIRRTARSAGLGYSNDELDALIAAETRQ